MDWRRYPFQLHILKYTSTSKYVVYTCYISQTPLKKIHIYIKKRKMNGNLKNLAPLQAIKATRQHFPSEEIRRRLSNHSSRFCAKCASRFCESEAPNDSRGERRTGASSRPAPLPPMASFVVISVVLGDFSRQDLALKTP